MVDWFIKNCKCNPLSFSAFLKRPAYFYGYCKQVLYEVLKKFAYIVSTVPVTSAKPCFTSDYTNDKGSAFHHNPAGFNMVASRILFVGRARF
jgi:hypothetical protein